MQSELPSLAARVDAAPRPAPPPACGLVTQTGGLFVLLSCAGNPWERKNASDRRLNRLTKVFSVPALGGGFCCHYDAFDFTLSGLPLMSCRPKKPKQFVSVLSASHISVNCSLLGYAKKKTENLLVNAATPFSVLSVGPSASNRTLSTHGTALYCNLLWLVCVIHICLREFVKIIYIYT